MSDRLFICTDLDRTLIPNGPQPESPRARERFAALVSRPEVSLAYVSGRHRELVAQAIEGYALPQPDFVVGDVGATIYRVGPDALWEFDTDWEAEIAPDWAEHSHDWLAGMLADIPGLRLQEPEKQNRFKLSYYTTLDAFGDGLARQIEARLTEAGIHSRVISSIDEEAGAGLLDVLPRGASKLHAIEALMRYHDFDPADTVFCGDSGNDLEVLTSAVPSVLVANAADDVREQAIEGAAAAGATGQLYIASGGLLGMNGCYAAGMLEGIAHFHHETLAWMEDGA